MKYFSNLYRYYNLNILWNISWISWIRRCGMIHNANSERFSPRCGILHESTSKFVGPIRCKMWVSFLKYHVVSLIYKWRDKSYFWSFNVIVQLQTVAADLCLKILPNFPGPTSIPEARVHTIRLCRLGTSTIKYWVSNCEVLEWQNSALTWTSVI